MIRGYARVSTADQNLEGQLEDLRAAGAEIIYREKLSGAKRERPELDRMLEHLLPGDVVLVKRCDRLARSTFDMLSILKTVQAAGAVFKSLTDSWANTDSAHGRLIITIMSGIAEFERELIMQRTQEGRDRARAAGKRLGGPKVLKMSPEAREDALEMVRGGMSNMDVAKVYGVSGRTIARLNPAAGRGTGAEPCSPADPV